MAECVLKTLACRGLRVGPSKLKVEEVKKFLEDPEAYAAANPVAAAPSAAAAAPSEAKKEEKKVEEEEEEEEMDFDLFG